MQWGILEDSLNWVVDSLASLNLGLQGWLIVLTLVVTGMSYRSQKRAGIREAIEQLDPRYSQYQMVYSRGSHNRDVQIKPGLDSFSMLRRRSKISFISNRIDDRSHRVVGHSVPPYYLTLPERRMDRNHLLRDRILSHEQIEEVHRSETEIVVTTATTNPVECRKVTNYVLNEMDHTVDNHVRREDFRPTPNP